MATTLSAVTVGNLITYSISGLGEGVNRKVQFRHKWGAADFSLYTAEVSKTNDVTPPAVTKPIGDDALSVFLAGGGTGDAIFVWLNNGGDGPWTVQYKIGTTGTVNTLSSHG